MPFTASLDVNKETSADQRAESEFIEPPPSTQSSPQQRCNCQFSWLREIHGLTASATIQKKMFWSAVIVLCCAASIAFATQILSDFKHRSLSTRVKVIPIKQLKFPTLTICPKFGDAFHVEPIFADMRSRLGELDERLAGDVLLYLIAGSGLQYIEIQKWTLKYRSKLNDMFLAWRGNRTQQHMYHFVFVENGYTCTELFHKCRTSSVELDCCKLFKSTFVLTRGRCFSLVDDYHQREYDEIGKLHIYLNQIKGARLIRDVINELIIYLGSSTVEIGPFPRIFLNYDYWNRFVFKQKRISMLNEKQCFASHRKNKQEKSACLLRKYIMERVVNILNCTLPPFNEILPYLANMTVCEPAKVAQFYEQITAPITEEFHCLPACDRIENQWRHQSSKIRGSSPRNHSYELEASFGELQYEEYQEIRLTTTLNFLSELGGQLGLFVGSSSMTYVQLLLSIAIYAYDLAKRTFLEHTVPVTSHQTSAVPCHNTV